jgi:hypothetical protein
VKGKIMLKEIHEKAVAAAIDAANEMYVKYGDRYPCGFAWVEVYGVKLSTKEGKEFSKLGFKKGWSSGFIYLWNPSGSSAQNVDIKERGAWAYAQVLQEAGYKAHAASRLD